MNKIKYLVAVVIAILMTGCPARSLFSLFSEKDFVSIPGIVGKWVNDGGETLLIQKSKDSGYDMISHDRDGSTSAYKVQLGRLGKSWFADSFPEDDGKDHHLIAAHIITKLWFEGDSLWISSLESDWLKRMIDAKMITISHALLGNDIILTASTEELQQLVLHCADDASAFPKPEKLIHK